MGGGGSAHSFKSSGLLGLGLLAIFVSFALRLVCSHLRRRTYVDWSLSFFLSAFSTIFPILRDVRVHIRSYSMSNVQYAVVQRNPSFKGVCCSTGMQVGAEAAAGSAARRWGTSRPR